MRDKKKYLLPLSWIYNGITRLRNALYDFNLLKSKSYDFPIICVGNLSTGGSGKSPFVLYLLAMIQKDFDVVTLSRGYKRKTKGFIVANYETVASEIGDEPMQCFKRFKNQVVVTVGEDRNEALTKIEERFDLDVVIMDDGLQHRAVNPGFKIVLTPEYDLYAEDYLLPAGNLRETKSRAQHAQVIVITKCKSELGSYNEPEYRKKLKLKTNQELFFSRVAYRNQILGFEDRILHPAYWSEYNVLVVTGIATPTPFVNHCKQNFKAVKTLAYPDHHSFVENDLNTIQRELENLPTPRIVLTTEKDYVRLQEEVPNFNEQLFYWPIDLELSKPDKFKQIITNYVERKSN